MSPSSPVNVRRRRRHGAQLCSAAWAAGRGAKHSRGGKSLEMFPAATLGRKNEI